MSCHTESGYRPMRRLLQARDQKGINQLLETLHNPPRDSTYVRYMPPLVGKPEEIAALGKYLLTLSDAPPPNSLAMAPSAQPGKQAKQ